MCHCLIGQFICVLDFLDSFCGFGFWGKTLIVSGLAESKKEHGVKLLNKLEAGIDEFELIV